MIQLEYDVDDKINAAEREMNSDIIKLILYIKPYALGMVAGIILLWLTQNHLSYEYYKDNKHHGLAEMAAAPFLAAWKNIRTINLSGTIFAKSEQAAAQLTQKVNNPAQPAGKPATEQP